MPPPQIRPPSVTVGAAARQDTEEQDRAALRVAAEPHTQSPTRIRHWGGVIPLIRLMSPAGGSPVSPSRLLRIRSRTGRSRRLMSRSGDALSSTRQRSGASTAARRPARRGAPPG